MPKGWFSGEGLLFPLPARFKPSKQTELNRAKTIGTTMAQSHTTHSNIQLAAEIDAGDGV
jgi:hypothetical protein